MVRQGYPALMMVLISVCAASPKSSECYENNCFALLSGNQYLTSATRLGSQYDVDIARQLLECRCLDGFDQSKGLRAHLKELLDAYRSVTANCNTQLCDKLINGSNAMYYYGSSPQIGGERDYGTAKQIVDSCDCWAAGRGSEGDQYPNLFKKMRGMIAAYEQRMAEEQRRDETAKQQAAEEQKSAAAVAQRKAQEDSLRKAEMPKEIAVLLNKPGGIMECASKCKEYSDEFGEDLDICSNALVKKIKALAPSTITSQDVADIRFTPKAEFSEWYMEGKQSGYIQFGGDVSWVTGGLAEIDMGSRVTFLVKFAPPWVVREGLPLMAYGEPIGNVTYRTAIGGSRTLPCLQLLWLYRPSLDKTSSTGVNR